MGTVLDVINTALLTVRKIRFHFIVFHAESVIFNDTYCIVSESSCSRSSVLIFETPTITKTVPARKNIYTARL